MEKIQLVVLGLSASPASNNAYALILKEVNGERRLPIIIGAFEAQAIALEMEGVLPPRPMTHDLMKNIIENLGANLTEVYINDLNEGTFFAKLIFDTHTLEIDSRPSDAVAMAVRFNAPIFVKADILNETGLLPQEDEIGAEEEPDDDLQFLKESQSQESKKPLTKVEQLQVQLDKAIKEEDYEKAAKLRDELKRIWESQ